MLHHPLVAFLACLLLSWVVYQFLTENTPEPLFLPSGVIIQGNSLMAISSLEYPNIQILASKIRTCENPSNDPLACNQQYGCIAGMGDYQLIPSTVKYCEEKLGRPIDPFIKEDNHACGLWLLENEGTKHWGSSTTDWGSWECWKDFDP